MSESPSESSCGSAGGRAPRLPDQPPAAAGSLALGSVPTSLLQPTTHLQLPCLCRHGRRMPLSLLRRQWLRWMELLVPTPTLLVAASLPCPPLPPSAWLLLESPLAAPRWPADLAHLQVRSSSILSWACSTPWLLVRSSVRASSFSSGSRRRLCHRASTGFASPTP
jgi:hypothetical protein